ncbi:MAG: hypothetical protein ABR527_11450 [Gemmatimonadota bacterium]
MVTEPWAYESGFALKWVIEAQIEQMRTGAVDPIAGDLSPAVAPIIIQGPYLWADGEIPRSDVTNPFTQCWFLAGRTCPL